MAELPPLEPILHQYPGSPFSEKVRAVLGLKRVAWRAVEIPSILPKPHLIALTGGYRRTPVLQLGADIYCDTECIVRRIDRLAPQPPLYPPAFAATAVAVAAWADSALFMAAAVLFSQRDVLEQVFAGHDETRQAFIADRVAMRKGARGWRPPLSEARALFDGFVRRLDEQLADGRPWALGSAPTIADFALYHPLWFVRVNPVVVAMLRPYAAVARWMSAVHALGHGRPQPLDAAAAVAIARSANPEPLEPASDDTALRPGDAVEVLPTDYALDPVAGELVRLSADGIAVRRESGAAGTVVVHFPRTGYEIRRQNPDQR